MEFKDCFFCGKPIEGKGTLEHIISDGFLEALDLKVEHTLSGLPLPTTYSRIKVPAHGLCNSQQGSRFEAEILALLKSLDANIDTLQELNSQSTAPLQVALRQYFVMWLCKIYFGFIYWEAGRSAHPDTARFIVLKQLLEDDTFAYLRRCFVQELSFAAPSSLYYFRLAEPPSGRYRFDFGTALPYDLVYVRIRKHLFIAAIADGHLVHEWLNGDSITNIQSHLDRGSADPAAYLHAVSHVWAIRELLPIPPSIAFQESTIADRSREGLASRPDINSDKVNDRAAEIYQELLERWK
jgi:hypothetical protein